jgi:adenosylcobinamide-GDP ribazoletransferase
MRALRDALGFLTVLPVRGSWPLMRSAIAAFPLAGLVIGLGWALAAGTGIHIGGPMVAAALVLAVDFGLTGGLHSDGLADTADGLASRRPPDQVGEVMKDPRIGAIGAAALITALLLRFALLDAVLSVQDWWVIALVPVIGRTALALGLRSAAPREGSLAAGPAQAATPGALIAAAVLAVGIAGAIGGYVGLAALAAGIVATHLTGRWLRRRLGGGGDVLGALGVLAETVTLAVLAVSH